MKNSKRSIRRYNKEKKKDFARKVMPYYEQAYKLADNLKHCSCDVCCNPRHNGYSKQKLTIQEIHADKKLQEQVKEHFEKT